MFNKAIKLMSALMLATVPLLALKTPAPGPNQTLSTQFRMIPPDPTIRILLEKDVDSAVVEANGPYRIFNPADGSITGSGLFGKCYPITATEVGLKWGEEFPDEYQIAIVPANRNTVLFVDGTAYPGVLYVYQVGSKISIVNQAKVEDYLKATLRSQMDTDQESEALAAAAIVARTNAYYQAVRYPKAFWQIDAKEVGYYGLDGIKSRNVDLAVDTTRYLVMRMTGASSYQGLFPATWTQHSAGKTAAASVILRKQVPGPEEVVTSAFAASNRQESSWNLLVKKSDLGKQLGVGPVREVSIFKDNASGKVYGLRVSGNSNAKEFDFATLQKTLGKEKLQSSDFSIDIQGDIVSFTGYGKGPGVGLCLYSANRMVEQGQDAVSVLHKFFPGSDVVMVSTLQQDAR